MTETQEAVTHELWPPCWGPEDLAEIERVPLAARGLPSSTYAMVTRAAGLWPDRTATSFLPDAERWKQPSKRTFAQLADDVRGAAHALSALGIGRRDAVALLSPNCEQLHTAILASEAVGIAAPVNPTLSPEHAAHLVRLAGARVVVAAGPELDPAVWELGRRLAEQTGAVALLALRPVLGAPTAPELEPLDGVTVSYLEELIPDAAGELPGAPPEPSDIASYLHTGGTTGMPKLAARTHANEVANAWMSGVTSALGEDSVLFAALPLFHTNALVVTVLAPLLRGQHVVWAGPLGYREDALFERFWKIAERYRLAAMSGVPTVYSRLAQVPVDADVSSIKWPIVGAAPLPLALVDAFKAATGLELCEGYGLTEATCVTSRNFPGTVRRGSVGQRLPYQDVRAARVDLETGAWELLPAGETGTLVIRGPNVFAGYLTPGPDGPVPDPGDKVRDGWLDTGDLGAVDEDGYVRLVGREKDLIIRGGHNIDPVVIEEALLGHPSVLAVAAVGLPDPHAGEVPFAYVVVSSDAPVDAETLSAWARERVPERAAAPKGIEVIDAIPVTAVGKHFKPELRRRAVERAAQGALGPEATVRGVLDGGAVAVEVAGLPEAEVAAALAPFAFPWRVV